MTARMLAFGKWEAQQPAPTMTIACGSCGKRYDYNGVAPTPCPHCRPPLNDGHDNLVYGLDGKPLKPWDLEYIFQEMEAAGELNPNPGDLDPLS